MNLLNLTRVLFALLSASAFGGETQVSISVDDIVHYGTLLQPDDGPSIAAAVIIAGSGPTDRNGNSSMLPGKNNSLKMLADALLSQQVTTLRFDKRMVGQSTNSALKEADLRFDDYVNDTHALASFLGDATKLPVILIGHSEGGHIAMVAASQKPYAGLVVIAGPGQHPADLLQQQLSMQLPAGLLEQSKSILSALRNGETIADTPPMLAALFRQSVQPYLISWFAHDPVKTLKNVKAPTLLIYGATDIQVPVSDGKLLSTAHDNINLTIVDTMNHVLKEVGKDQAAQVASYSDPNLALHKALAPAITAFIIKVAKN
jgi:pimeloyl-ACP methyl ester carboxylesterase